MKRCIIFDLDGTLIDSRLDLAAAVNHMRLSFQLAPLPAERVIRFVGNGVSTLVRRAVADGSVELPEALRRMKKFYADHLVDSTSLYPGVSAGLAELAGAGCQLAVLSNKPEPASRRILELLGVAQYFSCVIGGDGEFPLKPEPDALLHLQKQSGAEPAETFMVGDNYTDLEAARRAGVRAVYAAYGFGDPQQEPYEFKAEDFASLVKFLKPETGTAD